MIKQLIFPLHVFNIYKFDHQLILIKFLFNLEISVVSLLERYGWVIVLCLVICWFLFEKLKPQLYEWKTRRDEYNDKKNEGIINHAKCCHTVVVCNLLLFC